MTRSKYLLVPTITASLLVLAGCTLQPTTNTNTVNDNANVEVAVNTNETVDNENTNTSDESGEVDLPSGALSEVEGWLTYSDDRYASGEMLSGIFPSFSVEYPSDWLVDETLGGPVIYTPSMQSGNLPQKPEDFIVSIGNFLENEDTVYRDVPTTTQDCVDIMVKNNANYSVSNTSFIKNKEGIDAAVFDYTFADTTSSSRLYCFVQGGKAVIVSGSPTNSDLMGTFMDMIDTLKFN